MIAELTLVGGGQQALSAQHPHERGEEQPQVQPEGVVPHVGDVKDSLFLRRPVVAAGEVRPGEAGAHQQQRPRPGPVQEIG